jgi:hypothetical protein
MSGAEDNAAFRRAGAIVAASRAAALTDRVLVAFEASVRSSRVLAAIRRSMATYGAMPAGERGRCVLTAIAVAVAVHVVMARLLPIAARPTVTLSALVLLAVCLGAAATATRR